MHSLHKEGKPVVPDRFITTLINKIYKYVTSVSKNGQIDKLDDTVNKCNNVISDPNGEGIVGIFYEKEYCKQYSYQLPQSYE